MLIMHFLLILHMPTLGSHYSEDEVLMIKAAAKACADRRVGTYIGAAVRQRLEREGFVPGVPTTDVRSIALATAEVIGEQKVLEVLDAAKKEALACKAANIA